MISVISVDVVTNFVEDQSTPGDGRYVFAYTITIRNEGTISARLLSRHWIITDANGNWNDNANWANPATFPTGAGRVETFWTPHLMVAGYSLSFVPKAGATSSEGIAVLAKSSAFEVVGARTVRLDLRPPPPQLASYLAANPHTAVAASALPTVAQIVRLRKMKPDDRSEQDMLLETYKNALGMA